jgi:predicted MFS family arabinose efflux permease
MRAEIREGIAFLWDRPFLRTSALIFACDNLVFQGLFLVFIVVAKRQGLSSGVIGASIATFGGATLLGALAAPRATKFLSMRKILLVNQWLDVCFVLFLLFPNAYVLLALMLPIAFASPALYSVVVGYRTAVTPDHLIGRVSGVARNIALLAMPLGPLAAGFLLGTVSSRETIIVFAAISGAAAIWSSLSPSIRNAPSLAELDELSPASA